MSKQRKTEFLIARITKDQKDTLLAVAIGRKISLSVIIREMIEKFVNGQES